MEMNPVAIGIVAWFAVLGAAIDYRTSWGLWLAFVGLTVVVGINVLPLLLRAWRSR